MKKHPFDRFSGAYSKVTNSGFAKNRFCDTPMIRTGHRLYWVRPGRVAP